MPSPSSSSHLCVARARRITSSSAASSCSSSSCSSSVWNGTRSSRGPTGPERAGGRKARRAPNLLVRRVSSTSTSTFLSSNEVLDAAAKRGIALEYSTLGPGFKVTASVDATAVGYVSGFSVPLFDGGYVHFDEMRVLNKELRAMRDEGKRKKKVLTGNEQMLRQQNVVGAFGTGLLMGMYAMCTLRDSGCKTAELLAINDNEYQYRKLVKYYERMGFTRVREVGSGESPWYVDLGDQLVWGGCGCLMRAEVKDVIDQWTRSFKARKQD